MDQNNLDRIVFFLLQNLLDHIFISLNLTLTNYFLDTFLHFLGARAPLEIARVKKKKNNNRTKKFQIAITCSLLATKSEIVRDSQK